MKLSKFEEPSPNATPKGESAGSPAAAAAVANDGEVNSSPIAAVDVSFDIEVDSPGRGLLSKIAHPVPITTVPIPSIHTVILFTALTVFIIVCSLFLIYYFGGLSPLPTRTELTSAEKFVPIPNPGVNYKPKD
jgi:hypothetical protein